MSSLTETQEAIVRERRNSESAIQEVEATLRMQGHTLPFTDEDVKQACDCLAESEARGGDRYREPSVPTRPKRPVGRTSRYDGVTGHIHGRNFDHDVP